MDVKETFLEVEICPFEPRAGVFMDIERDSVLAQDLLDCCASGDAEPACQYVLDVWTPVFVISDRSLGYARRPARPSEIQATCEAIYHDHDKGEFANMSKASLYLIWEAAHLYEQECQALESV